MGQIVKTRRLGGILVRRECWTLSRRGWLLFLLLTTVGAWAALLGLHPFLAAGHGGTGDVMVVEGWISSRRIDQAAALYHQGHYQKVIVIRDVNDSTNKWWTGEYSAYYVSSDLARYGVPTNRIHTLFCPVVRKDRTYYCALAVRQWLREQNLKIKRLDVVTMAAHARRSRLVYGEAFGSDTSIGVVPIEDPTYDPRHWWRTSAGVREVVGEAIAYLYARFFFWPKDG